MRWTGLDLETWPPHDGQVEKRLILVFFLLFSLPGTRCLVVLLVQGSLWVLFFPGSGLYILFSFFSFNSLHQSKLIKMAFRNGRKINNLVKMKEWGNYMWRNWRKPSFRQLRSHHLSNESFRQVYESQLPKWWRWALKSCSRDVSGSKMFSTVTVFIRHDSKTT